MQFMPVGVIVNASAVLVGGIVGAVLGNAIPERIRTNLPLIFGRLMGIRLVKL